MTRFCTELASVCWQRGWLGFSRDDFSFFYLFSRVKLWLFFLWLVWRWQRVTGHLPCLYWGQDDGSGWLTVRKCYLWVNGDTFIEPVKLTGAMSWAKTRLTITHTQIETGGIETETCFWNPPDPEVVHQSNTDLCVTLGFSECLQSCLTSELLGECVVWILHIVLCRQGSTEKRL